MIDKPIGFLGAGQMARALARGFLSAQAATSVVASDVSHEARREFESQTGGRTTSSNREVLAECPIVVIAVKPGAIDGLMVELAGSITENHLIISIAAGVSIARISGLIGGNRRIIRVMPNTPCLVGASASGFSRGPGATEEDGRIVQRLLEAVGVAWELPESLLDAVTGLSGSGPAYVYLIIEALSDGGVRAGLPREVATRFAAQTVLGAARMVLETGKHPGELKDMVTSPAGTTIAGLAVLEQRAVRGAMIDAVLAASLRAKELGGG